MSDELKLSNSLSIVPDSFYLVNVGDCQYYVSETDEEPRHKRFIVYSHVSSTENSILSKIGIFVFPYAHADSMLLTALADIDKHKMLNNPYDVLGDIKQFCQSKAHAYFLVEDFADNIIDMCNGDYIKNGEM